MYSYIYNYTHVCIQRILPTSAGYIGMQFKDSLIFFFFFFVNNLTQVKYPEHIHSPTLHGCLVILCHTCAIHNNTGCARGSLIEDYTQIELPILY